MPFVYKSLEENYQAPQAPATVEEMAEPILKRSATPRADGVARIPFIELSERCMAALRARPRITADQLAVAVDRKVSTVKKVLTQLFNEGHVERDRQSTKDHYVYWVPDDR